MVNFFMKTIVIVASIVSLLVALYGLYAGVLYFWGWLSELVYNFLKNKIYKDKNITRENSDLNLGFIVFIFIIFYLLNLLEIIQI